MAAFFAKVMTYRNKSLLERIRHEMHLSKNKAEILFEDMLKFLFLHVLERPPQNHVHFSPPPKIDQAWHLFLLDTQEYKSFSMVMLEWTVHHEPRLVRKGSREEKYMHQCTLHTVERAKHHYRALSPNWRVPSIHRKKKETRKRKEVPVC